MVTVHSAIETLQRQVPRTNVLPIYIRLMLLITGIVSIGSVGFTSLVRLNKPIPNPFTAYADIFPGQPQARVIARGFSCQSSPQYCTSTPANSPFALIAVTLASGVVKELDFAMHPNTLVMGDLPVAWGRPQIEMFQESVLLKWESIGVSANAWSVSKHFSYFMALSRISFGRPGS
jgi:hypothetical protein